MLNLQCARRFPANPANPADSVLAELFPTAQSEPLLTAVPKEKEFFWWLNYNPLSFLSDCSAHKLLIRLSKAVWQAFFRRSLRAPIPTMLAHAVACTKCAYRMAIDPLGDHVLIARNTRAASVVTATSRM